MTNNDSPLWQLQQQEKSLRLAAEAHRKDAARSMENAERNERKAEEYAAAIKKLEEAQ